MADEGLMNLDEAAVYLGVAKIPLRRWTRDGQLRCVRVGKRGDRRFRRADLDAYSPAPPIGRATSTARRKSMTGPRTTTSTGKRCLSPPER